MRRPGGGLRTGLGIAIVFLCGAAAGEYFHPADRLLTYWRPVLERSSACSVLSLPEAYRSRSQRRRAAEEVKASARLVERDPAGYELWSTGDGRWWIQAGDFPNLNLVLAEQRCDIYGSRSVRIHPGDVLLDCGAHVGTFTRKALQSGARLVVAIEPAAESQECLRRNFAPEIGAGRVIVYGKGVWDREAVLPLSDESSVNHPGSAQHTVLEGQAAAGRRIWATVPLTTIDAIVKELRLDRVDYIKMDIEGAEPRALAGARGTLAAFRPRLAIAGYHRREDYRDIERVVRQASAAYRMECGPCYSALGIRPEALFFQ
jgi:FkbM family methyltransferase